MDATADVSFQGPTVSGSTVQRGVHFMHAGFVQNVRFTALRARYQDGTIYTSGIQDGTWYVDSLSSEVPWYWANKGRYKPASDDFLYSNVHPIHIFDSPTITAADRYMSGASPLVSNNMLLDFRDFIVVGTLQSNVNGSFSVLTPIQEFDWAFCGSGTWASGTWTGGPYAVNSGANFPSQSMAVA